MDVSWLIAIALGIGLVAALLIRRGRAADAGAVAELTGRLSQIAESQSVAQNQLSERLQSQERALTKTLEERLGEVSRRVSDGLEKSATQTHGTVSELKSRIAVIDAAQKHITELSTQMVSLQDILSNKQARGAFGQFRLNDIVADALPPASYRFEATLSNGKRVDCLIDLPNPPGPVAVDAKFPLEGFLAIGEARGEAALVQARRAFSTALGIHINDIAQKYILPGETADAAFMFLASEAVFSELHTNFRNVMEEAYRKRVYIVSPTTLWSALTTMRAVYKDVQMREQAGVIQKEVGALGADIDRLDKRVGNLERHFGQASEDIREIRISADKINNRAERIDSLQLDDGGAEVGEDTVVPPRRLPS